MKALLLAVVASVGLLGCGQSEAPDQAATPVFTFTAIPDQDEARLVERFSSVATYLEHELGVSVHYVPVKSYAAAVTAFRNDEVQLAWFGGLSGVQARLLVPGSRAIAQGAEDPYFLTHFIAHRSTGIEPGDALPEQIIGRSFTFGPKGSTSGRLMPEHHVRELLGDAPEALFSRVGYSGHHNATIALVESGAYEVGAVNYKVWNQALAEGSVDAEQVQVIWTTPPYPDYHWVIRGDVDARFGEGFAGRVQQVLLALDDRSILDAFPRERFIEASNEDYQSILDTGRRIGLID